jgi:predicted KAP-like P-loop ATPase
MLELKPGTTNLASDAPESDPAKDAFGYWPFARTLAAAISATAQPEGLTMAIHGTWGSGKSTLLNFVIHELKALPLDRKPIVIEFNPWWFDNRQMLAGQFLAQFASKLPDGFGGLREIGNTIAEYAESLGTVVAAASAHPWLKPPVTYLAKLFRQKVKAVPALKAEVAAALRETGQRIVFVIDDIDRLTADEIQEVFKVVKALANFPNVIYLLAFDRKIVADALTATLKMDGEAYLEKIIQAPFSLPALDRVNLRGRLIEQLNQILKQHPGAVDDKYWGNLFFHGLEHYIKTPRDVVRIINVLSVTFPAVAGEVNTVDFIAIEFLRVFEPIVYLAIRDNPQYFVGLIQDRSRGANDPELQFHEAWLAEVSQVRRASLKPVMQRLFPRLKTVWDGGGFTSEFSSKWKRELRACSPDIFDVYFKFGVISDRVSRREINELLQSASDPAEASKHLLAAAQIKRADGTSKVSEYLDWLRDLKGEVTAEAAKGLLSALFQIGDGLLSSADEQRGFFSVPNRWRVTLTINDLLRCIEPREVFAQVGRLLNSASAPALSVGVVESAIEFREKQAANPDQPLGLITELQVPDLKRAVIAQLRGLGDERLAVVTELDYVVHRWLRWDDVEYVKQRMANLLASDQFLPAVLEGYLRFGMASQMGDNVSVRIPRLNPKSFELFVDINTLESSVTDMLTRPDLTANQRTAGEQYTRGMDQIRAGKDPGDPFADF